MIRVGIVVNAVDKSWIGGLNYLANLVRALTLVPEPRVQPVLLVSDQTPADIVAMFPDVETVRSRIVAEGTLLRKARKVLERGFGRDLVAERFLKQNHIDVLSHSDQLGARARVPTIGWIADFQHLRMPEFFEDHECAARNEGYRRLVNHCNTIVLSSDDARRDLFGFAPEAEARSRVLRFVSGIGDGIEPTPGAELRAKYDLPGRFFYLPNQFWAHKNHRVVVEALAIARAVNPRIVVVCTGKTDDGRRPEYFRQLQSLIENLHVSEQFRILGLVPYSDVKALYRECFAVLNPSKFEGWSTSVEESKSQGKRMIVSDIPVHREQAPQRAVYFDPGNAEQLASALVEMFQLDEIEDDFLFTWRAAEELPRRFAEFGKSYADIVLEVAKGRNPR